MGQATTVEHARPPHDQSQQSIGKRFARWRHRNRKTVVAYTILSPMLIYFAIFGWLPVIFLFVIGFTDWSAIVWPPHWVGVANYITIFSDPYFHEVMQNTVVLGVSVLTITLIVGFSVALLLNQQIRGRGVFRTIWYLPAVLSGAVMAQMFAIFLSPSREAAANLVLNALFDMKPVLWPRDQMWMPIWVIIFTVWRSIGWVVVFFLAGLQSIQPVLYEAAKIDGANSWQSLVHVTIPQMRPIILFVTVTGLVGGLQMWEAPLLMTGGGPENVTNTLVFSMYRTAFADMQVGLGTAQAAILLLVIAAGIALQFRYYRRYE